MTAPDREVFLNEVREAIADELGLESIDAEQLYEGFICVGDLAQAAIDAMIRHMGPPF